VRRQSHISIVFITSRQIHVYGEKSFLLRDILDDISCLRKRFNAKSNEFWTPKLFPLLGMEVPHTKRKDLEVRMYLYLTNQQENGIKGFSFLEIYEILHCTFGFRKSCSKNGMLVLIMVSLSKANIFSVEPVAKQSPNPIFPHVWFLQPELGARAIAK
jgi:hypothetical protein